MEMSLGAAPSSFP